jgi:hypothetical protein
VTRDQFARAVAGLPGGARAAFELQAFQRQPYQPIAGHLEISIARVGADLREARGLLRSALVASGGASGAAAAGLAAVAPDARCERLHPFADGEVTHAERPAFQHHLGRCGACQEELEAVMMLDALALTFGAELGAASVAEGLLKEAAAAREDSGAGWWPKSVGRSAWWSAES